MIKIGSLSNFQKHFICLFFLLLPLSAAYSQVTRTKQYDNYIEAHKNIAIRHMAVYKIPASITLAQGLLESGAGQGLLVLKSNNHFGIKCHSGWQGQRAYKDDDKPNECFRKYAKAEDSFDDHSRFLADRPRYKELFDLDIYDYMGWARGLQKAGYATDKAYANKLIKIIDDYELYLYDRGGQEQKTDVEEKIRTLNGLHTHTPYKTYGLIYVIADEGDTYDMIANEFRFKVGDLYKYNEVPENFPLRAGDLVYFQSKKIRADKPYYEHEVNVGESMHSIAQLYGLKLINLYALNKKDFEYVPTEGDILKLR